MNINKIISTVVLFLFTISTNLVAAPIEITQFSLFLSSQEIPGDTSQDDQLGDYSFDPAINTFGNVGFDVQFENNLNGDNYGSVTWRVTNDTGSAITNSRLMGFFDADLGLNEFWNEYGEVYGDVSNEYSSWEIDEPGYLFGDIYDNLKTGNLDDSNNVPLTWADDVSLALGFDISDWLAGDTIIATFNISEMLEAGQSGLAQFDLATQDKLYFSGNVQMESASVPEPNSLILFCAGLLGLLMTRKTIKS